MKRTLCLMLALLLTLLAGCAQAQQSTDTPTQQTDAAATESDFPATVRKASDIVPALNAALKAQNIPLEFLLEEEVTYQSRESADAPIVEKHYDWYLAAFTDSGKAVTTETFDLSVYYPTTQEDDATILQIWIGDGATERERELHSTVCAIAAQLCDPTATSQSIDGLFAVEPTPTYYITHSDHYGTFTYKNELYGGPAVDEDRSVVFCAGEDLTHTLNRRLIGGEQWYEIYFDETAEDLYGDHFISGISVEQLEQGINDALAEMGVPVVCAFAPRGSYYQWTGCFRYTTLDDPNYTYPEYPYEMWEGYDVEVTQEMIDQHRADSLNSLWLDVSTLDPLRKDAPVRHMSFWGTSTLPELGQAVMMALDPKNGAEDFETLHNSEPVKLAENEEETDKRVMEKGIYTVSEHDYSSDNSYYYRYDSDLHQVWNTYTPEGEALLDPALLDYEFRLSEPMIQNGRFNFFNQSQQTNFYGDTHGYMDLASLLNDYLDSTCSNMFVRAFWDESGEHYTFFEGNRGDELDRDAFIMDLYSVAVDIKYNEHLENYLVDDGMYQNPDFYNFLRVLIGIARIFDQSLTWEDAIALHTQEGDYDFIATEKDNMIAPEGYQVTVCETDEVVHLLSKNPETGDHFYSLVIKSYVMGNDDYQSVWPFLSN